MHNKYKLGYCDNNIINLTEILLMNLILNVIYDKSDEFEFMSSYSKKA